jgi:hypothetical protein
MIVGVLSRPFAWRLLTKSSFEENLPAENIVEAMAQHFTRNLFGMFF